MIGTAVQGSAARTALATLALGALGIVFGDIATSPLYALQEAFGTHGVPATADNVLGVLSLTTWALILVVSIKYVVFIMRADNEGEGGSMALLALARDTVKDSPRLCAVVVVLGLAGVSLFFGDSVITPAVSVLSAVEGLALATPGLRPIVIPTSVVILIALFALQRYGTARVGSLFGPVMVLWLACIALLGAAAVVHAPSVLAALNPLHALAYLGRNGLAGFSSLGAVVLVLTGVEALYADMGHFGARPIRLAWFGFTLPALLLNYYGQGALLLTDPSVADSPFYHLVPAAFLYPMVALACAATVIASQAVISGAFSMTREAASLGYLPRLAVLHTSTRIGGQVYLPAINGLLLVLVLAAVLGFRTSENLAAAFGIAVSGTMLISTLLVMIVARRRWGWARPALVAFGVVFVGIDIAFLGANLLKIRSGGWFPLVLGAACLVVFAAWRRGRALMIEQLRKEGLSLATFVDSVAAHPPLRVPGIAIFLTASPFGVPQAMLHNLKHNKILHERNVILTVETLDRPHATPQEQFNVEDLGVGFHRATLRFGLAEDHDVPQRLQGRAFGGQYYDAMTSTFFLSRETVVPTDRPGMPLAGDALFAFLTRNAQRATAYFAIPVNRLVEIGSRVEI